jgi:hypothetical protein
VINQATGVITAGFDRISGFTNSGSIFAGHDGISASSANVTSKSGARGERRAELDYQAWATNRRHKCLQGDKCLKCGACASGRQNGTG